MPETVWWMSAYEKYTCREVRDQQGPESRLQAALAMRPPVNVQPGADEEPDIPLVCHYYVALGSGL